jgi:hypothetical protein
MATNGKRLITLLVASTLAIGAGLAASQMAGMTADDTEAEESEIQQPVPEALMPPIAPWAGRYGM